MAMTMKQVQNLLQYLGYYKDIPDDLYGPKTLAAITKFQTVYEKMGIDGIHSPQLEAALIDAVATGQYFNPEEASQQPEKAPDSDDFWADIKHFKREEFRCKCGGKYCDGFPVEPDEELVRKLDAIREHFGVPFRPTSAIRCEQYNDSLPDSSPTSQHMTGRAADIPKSIAGGSVDALYAYAESIMGGTGGLGKYSWGIHIDTRPSTSRWDYR